MKTLVPLLSLLAACAGRVESASTTDALCSRFSVALTRISRAPLTDTTPEGARLSKQAEDALEAGDLTGYRRLERAALRADMIPRVAAEVQIATFESLRDSLCR